MQRLGLGSLRRAADDGNNGDKDHSGEPDSRPAQSNRPDKRRKFIFHILFLVFQESWASEAIPCERF